MAQFYFSKELLLNSLKQIKEMKLETLTNEAETCLDDWKWDEGFAAGLQEALNIIERNLILPPASMKEKAHVYELNLHTEINEV